MALVECPKCEKYGFNVNAITSLGVCRECGYRERITEDIWKLKYDDGYRYLRETLKYNTKMREHLIEFFELEKPESIHTKFLLTSDVMEVLEKDAPEIFNRLNKK